MEYRQLGHSDLKLPVVSFGAWAIGGWLWGGTDDAAAIRAIHCATDVGITCIDTAPTYGMGHSETIVGKAIAGRRDKVIVATKCGVRWDLAEGQFSMDTKMNDGTSCKLYRNLRPNAIKYECDQSLRRLGVDVIDLYQCHWPDPTTPIDDTMAALVELKSQGKIRYFGVSNFSVEQMSQCLKTEWLASDQPKYNALEREVEKDVLPFCIEHNIGVLAYSPLARGLLTGKIGLDREFKEGDARTNLPWMRPQNRGRVLEMLEQIRSIADGHGATVGQVAINWVIAQPGLTSALVGARNENQVRENAGAADFHLSKDELATIRRLVEALGEATP